MVGGVGNNSAQALNQAVDTPTTTAGASAGGYLVDQKDLKHAQTDPHFGEIMKQFQTQYGAKPEKAREIKKTLGKDDFLKIMITQMKNQDPSKPFNADQMAQQMAQYASVEQLQNVNQNIQKLESDNKTSERMAMTGMIGKMVTVDRERFQHVEGQNESLAYALPKNATEVKLIIQAENGEPILEKDLGPQKSGDQTFSWDGAKSNTIATKNGTFIFKIIAKDDKGVPIQTNPQTRGKIIGVGFEGSEPAFLIGDARSQQKVTMKNIIKIEEAVQAPSLSLGMNPALLAQMGMSNGAQAGAQANAAANTITNPAASNSGDAPSATHDPGKFFTFKKGEGSQNLDVSDMAPDQAQALARYQQAQGAANPQPPTEPGVVNAGNALPDSKGFPNGLSN